MEDRLIFRYHLDRANPKSGLLSETPHLGSRTTHLVEGSEGGTQEGR